MSGWIQDLSAIPAFLKSLADPVFEFNKRIIDATSEYCVSYKINTAFYEARGFHGWETMQKTADYIPSSHFKIADAKRGDIGNSSAQYAKAFSRPWGSTRLRWLPIWARTASDRFLNIKTNGPSCSDLPQMKDAKDFELQQLGDELLFESVMRKASRWGTTENLMFVIGATKNKFNREDPQIYTGSFLPGSRHRRSRRQLKGNLGKRT